jgi:hypothetical protein
MKSSFDTSNAYPTTAFALVGLLLVSLLTLLPLRRCGAPG